MNGSGDPGTSDTARGPVLAARGPSRRGGAVDEVIPDAPPAPWADALSAEQGSRWWQRAQSSLTDPFAPEDFERWFFGDGEAPRGTGYTLGARLVRAYLQETGTTAAEAVDVDARHLIEESPYNP